MEPHTFPQSLSGRETLQLFDDDASEPAWRAVRNIARIAQRHRARLSFHGDPGLPRSAFSACKETELTDDARDWVAEQPTTRIVLRACVSDTSHGAQAAENTAFVELAPWYSEATFYTASGLADLNGHPNESPQRIAPATRLAMAPSGR